MGDRHVMTDAAAGGVCGCGCGRALPAGPAGGGRAPRYAGRACQQRAYRARTATRVPPADPASVAGLMAALRELGTVLDAGGHATAGQVAAVRDGAAALLARLDTPTAGGSPAPAGPGTVPAGSSRDDRAGGEDGGGEVALPDALAAGQAALDRAAATVARHGRGHTLRRPPDSPAGTYQLLLTGDVHGGSVSRTLRPAGWQPTLPGPLPRILPVCRTRTAAAETLLDALEHHHRTRRRRRR